MSVAYCANCLEQINECHCENQREIFGEIRLYTARIVKMLRQEGENRAADLLDENLLAP